MIINKKVLQKFIEDYKILEDKINSKKKNKLKFVTSADVNSTVSSSNNTYICGEDNGWTRFSAPLGYIDPSDVFESDSI